uniref:Rhodanese domain-containing protein n=1 Tax=Vitrella brassicaformis TaxID=1169539 RepID=A0A7S1P9M2_9ALVE|mmetsp:Transcript_44935/g.111605  ORF Transcript_44935/g.111605 Transcript_44935/m.111605 type:complete len:115 (+) Transcript_44935:61-405(+)
MQLCFSCCSPSMAMGSSSRSDLKATLTNPNRFLLDVRSAGEYAGGHIEGSTNIPHTQIEGRASELPADKSTPIVCFCASGMRSNVGIAALKKLGYTKVVNGGTWRDVQGAMRGG